MGSDEVSVPCESCSGCGRRWLHPHEQKTFDAVTARRWCDTSEVVNSLCGVKKTAVINRLNKLVGLGLVERRRHPDGRGSLLQWRRK